MLHGWLDWTIGRRRSFWLTSLALACVLVPATDGGLSQTAGSEFDLALQAFTPVDPLVVDVNNRIAAIVKNMGTTPLRARVLFNVTSDTIRAFTIDEVDTDFIPGGRSVEATTTWQGREPGADGHMAGIVTLAVSVTSGEDFQTDPRTDPDEPNGNSASVQRLVIAPEFSVTAAAPPSGESIAPGETWQGFLQVTNLGNARDTALLSLPSPPPGWAAVLGATAVDLEPGASRGLLLTATAPYDATAGQIGLFDVLVASQRAPNLTNRTFASTPPVQPAGALDVAFLPASAAVAVGKAALFNVTVRNLQNHDDNVTLVLEPVTNPQGLLPLTPVTPVRLAPGQAAPLAVRIDVPAAAKAGVASWTVKARSSDDLSLDPVAAPGAFTLQVIPWYGVDAVRADGATTVEPGEPFEPAFSATNLGNAPDTLRLLAPGLPTDWTMPTTQASALSEETVSLAPAIDVPSSSAPGTRALTFRVQSAADASKFEDLPFQIAVQPRPVPQLDTAQPNQPITGGGDALFVVNARNAGNAADDFLVEVDINETLTSPAAGWDIVVEPDQVTLGPAGSAPLSVRVTAPAGLQAPEGGVVFLVRLVSASFAQRVAELSLQAFPSAPDLEVAILETEPTTPYRSHPATVALRVLNNGTADTTVPVNLTVVFREEGKTAALASYVVPVGTLGWVAGLSEFPVTLAMPTGVGQLRIEAEIDADDEAVERDEADNEAVRVLTLPVFRPTLLLPADRVAQPGQAISFDNTTVFRVTNQGDRTETFLVRLTAPAVGVLAESTQVDVAPGSSFTLPLNFVVPVDLGTEEIAITLSVAHASLEDLSASHAVRVRVPDDRGPEFANVTASAADTVLGEPVTFRATVRDPMGVRSVRLYTIDAAGRSEESTARPDAVAGTYVVTKALKSVGTHRAYFWAEDNATRHNARDTAAAPMLAHVGYNETPSLILVAPQVGATIPPGTDILVAVHGRSTVAAAQYAVNNVTHQVTPTNPLQIPTAGWVDGPAVVRVHVVDALGATADGTFTFTIDGTPPLIGRILMDPPVPREGLHARIAAEVRDPSGIHSVILRPFGPGAGSLERPLLRQQGDVFAGTLVWSNAYESIAVLAKDGAGNEAYTERSALALLALETEGPGLVPAPSAAALVALLALAAIAVEVRRRDAP